MDILDFKDENEYADQMHTGALLNPRIDSTFKALFTRDTKESREALHSFLEAATELKISEVVLKPNDDGVRFISQRSVSYDILCTLDNGQCANIEMQAFNQAYDYGKRAEHQVARLEVSGLKKGESWQKAPKVFQISVLNFVYKNEMEKTEKKNLSEDTGINHYVMQTASGRQLANILNVIFIELPLIAPKESTIEKNTPLENWAIFLKEADNPRKTDLIVKLTKKEAGLMQAQKSLSAISADRDLWLEQFRQETLERDILSAKEASEELGYKKGLELGIQQGIERGIQQGIERGIQQGIEQGLQSGFEKGRLLVAQNLLRSGKIPLADIIAVTGLSEEKLQQIANSQ